MSKESTTQKASPEVVKTEEGVKGETQTVALSTEQLQSIITSASVAAVQAAMKASQDASTAALKAAQEKANKPSTMKVCKVTPKTRTETIKPS